MNEWYEKLIGDLEYARQMTDVSEGYLASLYARAIKVIKLLVGKLEVGWILADAQLPDQEGPYLVIACDNEMHVYYFRKISKFGGESPVWWTPDDELEIERHVNWVTHWRLLPEKPDHV